MREILFRGKRKENCKWVEGYYVRVPFFCDGKEKHFIQTIMADGRMGILHEVTPETVGQYTGLKDKNGVRIFEGDIIKDADINGYNCYVVAYRDNVDYHKFESNGLSEQIASYQYHYEVIGNVHDNPELLEGV